MVHTINQQYFFCFLALLLISGCVTTPTKTYLSNTQVKEYLNNSQSSSLPFDIGDTIDIDLQSPIILNGENTYSINMIVEELKQSAIRGQAFLLNSDKRTNIEVDIENINYIKAQGPTYTNFTEGGRDFFSGLLSYLLMIIIAFN